MGQEVDGKGDFRGGEARADDLFENFSNGEAQMLADASPFRDKPMPIGGSRKGIPNKRTGQMRDLYLKSGFPHPMLWQGSMLRLGIDGLAKELGCDKIEASELLRKIAADLAPYMESRMPTAIVGGDGEKLPVLIVGDVQVHGRTSIEQRSDGSMAIDDDLAEAIEASQAKSDT